MVTKQQSSQPQHWLYPINSKSNHTLLVSTDAGEEEREVTRENIWWSIDANPNAVDSWYLATGYRKMREDDFIWIVDVAAPKAIVALARALRDPRDEGGWWAVDIVWDAKTTRLLRDHPIFGQDYSQRAMSVASVNPDTQSVLENWLTRHRHGALMDKRRINDAVSQDDARRRVIREIAQRQGQQNFRGSLLRAYDQRCAISGSRALHVLEAAHISPYRGDHTNVMHNGLLLRSDLHTLFDLHLISIGPDDRVLVSSELNGTEYETYRGKRLRLPRDAKNRPSKTELKRHAKQHIS